MDSNFLNLNKKIKEKVTNEIPNHITENGRTFNFDGEEITHLYKFSLAPNYISEKQLESYKSKEILGRHEKENGGFIFMFYRTLQSANEIIPNLTKSDIARLLFLSTYISYEDNKIQHDNGVTMNDDYLIKLLRFNKQSYKKFIYKLEESNILRIDENGAKIINKYFCKYGKIDKNNLQKNNISYIRLFKNTVRELFEITPIRELGRLSIVYMILPYLNLASNIISSNPEEKVIENVLPMTISELASNLGYSNMTKFRQSLYSIKIGDEVMFGFFLLKEDKRTMRIVVNPKIVFAGDAEQLKVLLALFNNK